MKSLINSCSLVGFSKRKKCDQVCKCFRYNKGKGNHFKMNTTKHYCIQLYA